MPIWKRRDEETGTSTPPPRRGGAYSVVEECEAFLTGTYVELCESRGSPVPVWAWMNVLAHGTVEQLRAIVTVDPRVGPWRLARGFVAAQLLELVDADRLSLPAYQSRVLVPLELDVIACPGADLWRPGQMVSGLLGALPAKRQRDR